MPKKLYLSQLADEKKAAYAASAASSAAVPDRGPTPARSRRRSRPGPRRRQGTRRTPRAIRLLPPIVIYAVVNRFRPIPCRRFLNLLH